MAQRQELWPIRGQPQEQTALSREFDFAFGLTARGRGYIEHATRAFCPSLVDSVTRAGGNAGLGHAYSSSGGTPIKATSRTRFTGSPGTVFVHIYSAANLPNGSPAFFSVRDSSTLIVNLAGSSSGASPLNRVDLNLGATNLNGSVNNQIAVGQEEIVAASWGPNGMRTFTMSFGPCDTNTVTAVPASTSIVPWIHNRSTGGRGFAGEIFGAFGILQQLPDDQILQLLRDPGALYAGMFGPQRILVPVASAPGGPPTLTALTASMLTSTGGRLTVTA